MSGAEGPSPHAKREVRQQTAAAERSPRPAAALHSDLQRHATSFLASVSRGFDDMQIVDAVYSRTLGFAQDTNH